MSIVTPQGDIERATYEYLISVPEVTALPSGTRIYSELPADKTFPLVKIQRRGGQPVDDIPWADHPILQVDCYGGGRAVASNMVHTIRAALANMFGVQGDVVVNGVTFGPIRYLPETDMTEDGKQRPRYSSDVTIHCHPVPT